MNVIWIISDTFRRDRLGAYGNETIHTPSLGALATKFAMSMGRQWTSLQMFNRPQKLQATKYTRENRRQLTSSARGHNEGIWC